METKELVRVERLIEPAKRWRNRWKVLLGGVSLNGHRHAAGDTITSPFLWPSKEVAEQKGLDETALCVALNGGEHRSEYIGAFPEAP